MAATSVTATNTYDNFLIDEQTIALPTVFASHVLVSMTISTPNTADFSPLGQPYIGGLDVVTVGNGIVATPELPTYVMGLFGLGGIALLRRRQLQA
jgi:MYXO-CTERM domain-containing protein